MSRAKPMFNLGLHTPSLHAQPFIKSLTLKRSGSYPLCDYLLLKLQCTKGSE